MSELEDLFYCVVNKRGILGIFAPPVIDPVTRGRKRKAQFSPLAFDSFKSAQRICDRLTNMTKSDYAVSAYNVRTGAVMRPPVLAIPTGGPDDLGRVLRDKRRRKEKAEKLRALTEKARREGK